MLPRCNEEERYNGTGEMRLNLKTDGKVTIVSKSAAAEEAIPSAADFTIQLENKEGTYSHTFPRYAEMPETLTLPIGEYTITGSHGDETVEGFISPYFEGQTAFSLGEGKSTEVDLTCYLGQVKVTVNLSDGFVNYFKNYTVVIKNAAGNLFFFDEDTEGDLYLKPGALSMEISVTKQNGVSSVYEPVTIGSAAAAEHYIFNIDVNGGEVGGEAITITFNDETEENPVTIDLSDEAINVKAPFFTLTGFENGQVFTIKEGTILEELSALITARGKFKSVELTVESPSLVTGGTIDLVGILTYQNNLLKNAGLEWTDLTQASNESSDQYNLQMAIINFTDVIPQLRTVGEKNEHHFSITVTDRNGKKNEEELTFTVITEDTGLDLITPSSVLIGSSSAQFPVIFKGDPELVRIQYSDGYGNWSSALSHSVSENPADDYYIIEAELPVENKPLQVRAVYGGIVSSVQTLDVTVPKFSLELENGEGDVWATKAYIKIIPENSGELDLIKRFLSVEVENLKPTISYDGDILHLAGLISDSELTIRSTCGNKQYVNIDITTEAKVELPNFKDSWYANSISDVSKGGRTYNGIRYSNAPVVSIDVDDILQNWATNNAKTVYEDAGNKNTWYLVPSVLKNNDYILLRNVAWHNNGEAVKDNTYKLFSSTGTPNPPSDFHRSAGTLFLGNFNYDGNDQKYEQGLDFVSRPTSISVTYRYNAIADQNDKGVIRLILISEDDEIILEQIEYLNLSQEMVTYIADLKYNTSIKKAKKIKLLIASSHNWSEDQDSEDINIKTEHDLTNLFSVGSELYLDNIQLNYE